MIDKDDNKFITGDGEKIKLLQVDMPSPELIKPLIERMYDSGQFTNFGPLSREFESILSELVSGDNCISTVTTSNGTAALELALTTAFKYKHARKVILPSLTFPATAHAVIRSGHEPVWADVDPNTWQLQPESIYTVAKHQSIAAVIPVAAFGNPVDIHLWDNFMKETGIPVVVDAAGAFGVQKVEGQLAVVFSFHATKSLAIGEGGCVMSADPNWIKRIQTASNFAFEGGVVKSAGNNSKMSELHAAVGLAALHRWPQTRQRRIKLAQKYTEMINDLQDIVSLPANHRSWVRSVFVVRGKTKKAWEIAEHCRLQGIPTRQWYYPPLHAHPYFRDYPSINTLSITELLTEHLIGLPFHLQLNEQQLSKIKAVLTQMRK